MTFESAYPKFREGEVLGWLVFFGHRGEHRAFFDRSEGPTKALTRSQELHGRIVPVLAGEDFKWVTEVTERQP